MGGRYVKGEVVSLEFDDNRPYTIILQVECELAEYKIAPHVGPLWIQTDDQVL